jgi:AraC-like DNA-binding protein
MNHDGSVAEKVQMVLDSCEGVYPNHDDVARLLAMSSRTLRRKLELEQTNFQRLLDQVRSRQAINHLQHTQLPLSSIAYMVGFNDASNFRRAFKRWTGKTPLAYRQ